MLKNLDALIETSKQIEPSTFFQISKACKAYVENMTLENMSNTKPIEEGLVLLKSILSHLKRGEPFAFDYSDVLNLLEVNFIEEQQPEKKNLKKEEKVTKTPTKPKKISGDDMEILIDFVSEANDNLDTIEVNLIELEQDPSNMDIINDIFRPFHTIKGVSGFYPSQKSINLPMPQKIF